MSLSNENYKFWNQYRKKDQHSVIAGPISWEDAVRMAPEQRRWLETPIIREYLESINRPAVAEIGCGLGRLLKVFAKDYYVAGFDISARMIKGATQYLKDDILKVICLNQVFYGESGTKILPLDKFPEKFHFIFAFLVFQHLQTAKEIENYIDHMALMLKPGGYIRIQTHIGEPHPEDKFGGFHGHFFPSLEELVKVFHRNTKLGVMESEQGVGHPDWLWVTAKKAMEIAVC